MEEGPEPECQVDREEQVRAMDARTAAMQRVARKRAALDRKKLAVDEAQAELEDAMRDASEAGVALRLIGYQAGVSHETARTMIGRAVAAQ